MAALKPARGAGRRPARVLRTRRRWPAGARGPAAGADDEHPQRRRPRRHQRRLPGVHGDAGRLAVVPEALRAGTEIFHALRAILKKRGLATGVGDEGGFAPSLKTNRDALDVVLEAIGKAGLRPASNIYSRSTCAASEFWDDGRYEFKKSGEAPDRASR